MQQRRRLKRKKVSLIGNRKSVQVEVDQMQASQRGSRKLAQVKIE